MRSTAVRLFVERARQHKPSFAVDEREAPALAELVTRLEGIPLALELAAARLRSLALGEINARLEDRYKLLTGGGRALLARQQTSARIGRLVVRPAERARAGSAPAALLVRRWLRPAGGRGCVRRLTAGSGGYRRPAGFARRQVAGTARTGRRRHPVSDAGDDP